MNVIKLPFWMNKGELKKLATAGQTFWELVEQWLRLPLAKTDLLSCDLILVNAVAWERKIVRLEGESEMIYRKRVNYAFLNAQDAGMNAGIKRIFERLGIQIYDIKERQPERDWDIVTIELDDATLSDNRDLVNLLIQTYGATCRRYEYNVNNTMDNLTLFHGEMAWHHQTHVCDLKSSKKVMFNGRTQYAVVPRSNEINLDDPALEFEFEFDINANTLHNNHMALISFAIKSWVYPDIRIYLYRNKNKQFTFRMDGVFTSTALEAGIYCGAGKYSIHYSVITKTLSVYFCSKLIGTDSIEEHRVIASRHTKLLIGASEDGHATGVRLLYSGQWLGLKIWAGGDRYTGTLIRDYRFNKNNNNQLVNDVAMPDDELVTDGTFVGLTQDSWVSV